MSKQLRDKLVVIDLEATCEDSGKFPRPEWHSEIIEIGVCLLDIRDLTITNKESFLVKPISSPITEFCTSLTTITQELLDEKGTTLAVAIDKINKEYLAKGARPWASWGFYDNKMLKKDCEAKKIRFLGQDRTHLNLKNILATERAWPEEISVGEALGSFGLKFNGTPHRGHDDAENIARIYAEHLKQIRNL